MSIYHLLNK